MFNLAIDGDLLEREAHPLFLNDEFPSYELFWQDFIVPLTNRPLDIHTKSDKELLNTFPTESILKIHERVIILQLHYSVFRMLYKAKQLLLETSKDINSVETFFSKIYSALDISAELFGRYEKLKNNIPILSDAFDQVNSVKNSFLIRKHWQKNNPYSREIQVIRNYRNLMLHGQMFGCMQTPAAGFLAIPNPEKIQEYLDWRSVTKDNYQNIIDFMYTINITTPTFRIVMDFLESEWKKNLV